MAKLGIEQRVPLNMVEMALLSVLNGNYTPEYFKELAQTEFVGENRAKKMVGTLNSLVLRNPLLDMLGLDPQIFLIVKTGSHFARILILSLCKDTDNFHFCLNLPYLLTIE